jgi:hypothetical protein
MRGSRFICVRRQLLARERGGVESAAALPCPDRGLADAEGRSSVEEMPVGQIEPRTCNVIAIKSAPGSARLTTPFAARA